MTKSTIILACLAFMVVLASSTGIAAAQGCRECGGIEDWTSSATNFLEGKPTSDVPSSFSGPQLSRLKNTEFHSDLLKGNANNSISGQSNPASDNAVATQRLDIDLKEIRALPNPVGSGGPVMIDAVFKENNVNSSDNNPYNVYAVITDSDGTSIGKVNMEPTSEWEYAGIWNAGVPLGIYNTAIVASSSGASKMFNDTLQIEVISSE